MEKVFRENYLKRTDFNSSGFKGTPICIDRSKFGGYYSGQGCIRSSDLQEYEYFDKGDGRRSRFLTRRCSELSRKAGVEFFRYYRQARPSTEKLKKRARELRFDTDSINPKVPVWVLMGYYFPEEIVKKARGIEQSTTDRRRKDRVRKARQRERERLARLATQRPLIEEILTVLNTILDLRIELEKISTHELICTDSLALYDREKEIWTLEEGVYEVDTENAKSWLREFGNRFRDGTLAINTKNPSLQRQINEVMQFGKK